MQPFTLERAAWSWRRALGLAVLGWTLAVAPAHAERGAKEFAATLNAAERQQFEAYLSARAVHEFKVDAYWREVSDKRALRKRKKGSNTVEDYVLTFPPVYSGPTLSPALAKRWEAFQEQDEVKGPPPEPKPGLEDFLAHAKSQYDFEPERVPEREFKLRYAREALALGLTKDQVVRIYALETSGLGTAEMVAGVHPITKKGSPISTAIGYAQLLAANSVDELAKSGPAFIDRLNRLSARSDIGFERAAQLMTKAEALKRMVAAVRSVKNEWSNHVAFARTPRGLGVHAVNLDGDIGPWLQVIKLKGLKEMATRKGVEQLTGAEIELMNLAGPATGLEMMRPVARDVPTPNFFERNAYWRNTIVREKTCSGLIAALDERMQENIKNSGAVEFAEVFDQAAAERLAGR